MVDVFRCIVKIKNPERLQKNEINGCQYSDVLKKGMWFSKSSDPKNLNLSIKASKNSGCKILIYMGQKSLVKNSENS